ncbi:MAG: hypothetical protein COB22_08775 [Cycloclasticus sp.]|nr:MAG: hypothetical protein COB22_08775 [Cycloclasticus sp.]
MIKSGEAFQEALFKEVPKRRLTPREEARLQRAKRSHENKRGRKKPAKLPSQLSRTAAFAPKRQGLITDSNFSRTYTVSGPGGSVINVEGRELGSQHRDALYALFRFKAVRVVATNPHYDPMGRHTLNNPRQIVHYEVMTSWRDILIATDKTQHANNLLTALHVYEDIKKVVVRVQEGDPAHILEANKSGGLGGSGFSGNLLDDITWDGVELDSRVYIRYGKWVRDKLERTHIVSLNAEVQFKLKNDHAKSFWPYIDSQPNHTFIDEHRLAELAGRDLWGNDETALTRGDFRKKCKAAFDDMVKCFGLAEYTVEVTGAGRRKGRRYTYIHALPRQIELSLDAKKRAGDE